MEDLIGVLVLLIAYSVLWGIVCNRIVRNRGYRKNWFWWGFFFSLPAALVALSLPQRSLQAEESAQMSRGLGETQEKETLKNGAWKCGSCGQVNSSSVAICACGGTKPRAAEIQKHQEKEMLENGAWRCSACGQVNASYIGTCSCGKAK